MDWEFFIKIGTLFLTAIGAGKIVYEIVVGKRTVMRKDYEFSRDFLAELTSTPEMHPFLKETGYQALAGNDEVCAAEIEYLLSLERPDRALRDYLLGRGYLEYLPKSDQRQICFQKKYQSEWARKWRRNGSFILYVLFVVLAVLPLFLTSFFKIVWSIVILSLFTCGAYAGFFLLIGIRIVRAERLVKNQKLYERNE